MSKNLLLLFFSFLFTVLLAEGVLRMMDQIPGQLRSSPWLKKVDELHPLYGFTTDQNGINKVDTGVVNNILRTANYELEEKAFNKYIYFNHLVPEVALVVYDHFTAESTDEIKNEFTQYLRAIHRQASHGPLNESDKVLVNYSAHPVNADGFYSIPFSTSIPGRTKVLLLGDSFTWGHSSKNKTGSFANTLLARDYLVYNTGISGADMAQYMRILETYMDSIDPDIVVLNFYMGNDVSYYTRIPEPGLPIHFNTNAGNLMAFQDGVQFRNAQSAYDNIIRNMVIPQNTAVNRLLSRTVVTTLLWKALVRLGIIHHDYFFAPPRPEIPVCNQEMEQIRAFCKARNKKFILSIIPNLTDGRLDGVTSVPNLFPNIPYHEPQMTVDLFSQRDGHFNEAGHLFYANYLEKLILAAVGSE